MNVGPAGFISDVADSFAAKIRTDPCAGTKAGWSWKLADRGSIDLRNLRKGGRCLEYVCSLWDRQYQFGSGMAELLGILLGNRIYVSECMRSWYSAFSIHRVLRRSRRSRGKHSPGDGHWGWSCSSLCLPGRRHFLYSRSEAACSDQKIENYNCCHAGRRSTIVGLAGNVLYSSYTKIKGVKRGNK